jgi:hypothetical protein
MDPTPDSTVVRLALWRAQHVETDVPPSVFEDVVGLPIPCRDRRPRSIEDLLAEAVGSGIAQ